MFQFVLASICTSSNSSCLYTVFYFSDFSRCINVVRCWKVLYSLFFCFMRISLRIVNVLVDIFICIYIYVERISLQTFVNRIFVRRGLK